MKIYIDLVLFLNFAFDFLLLLTVSIILKRNTTILRIFIGSIIGSLTILVLFIPLTSFELFILKIFLSILIIISTFGYKDLKYTLNNLLYFYITSIILGGFLYYLNIEFSYKNIGMIFYHKEISINYIFLLIASPIILLIYTKEMKKLKTLKDTHYKVDLYIKDKMIRLNGFMDTGNTLIDPYKKRKIIIVNKNKIEKFIKETNTLLVPIETINGKSLLKCIRVNKIYIENLGIRKNILVGISYEKIKQNGIDCILNYLLMEGE